MAGCQNLPTLAEYDCICNATHIVMPNMNRQVAAIQIAVHDAHITRDRLDEINVHATSTSLEDIVKLRPSNNFSESVPQKLPSAPPKIADRTHYK